MVCRAGADCNQPPAAVGRTSAEQHYRLSIEYAEDNQTCRRNLVLKIPAHRHRIAPVSKCPMPGGGCARAFRNVRNLRHKLGTAGVKAAVIRRGLRVNSAYGYLQSQ